MVGQCMNSSTSYRAETLVVPHRSRVRLTERIRDAITRSNASRAEPMPRMEHHIPTIVTQEATLLTAAATLLVEEDKRTAVIEQSSSTWPWSPVDDRWPYADLFRLLLARTTSDIATHIHVQHGWPVTGERLKDWIITRISAVSPTRGKQYADLCEDTQRSTGGTPIIGIDLRDDFTDLRSQGRLGIVTPDQLAHLCAAVDQVDADRRKPAIHVDAGKAHHQLITGIRAAGKTSSSPGFEPLESKAAG